MKQPAPSVNESAMSAARSSEAGFRLALEGVSLVRGNKRVLKELDLTFEAEPRRRLIIGPVSYTHLTLPTSG